MRNKETTKIKTIFAAVEKLPYFSFDDLASLETNKVYLKILFSRYEKAGKVIRLKKGIYVSKDYIDKVEKSGRISTYLEFLVCILYIPSYISLDYILYKYNILTEVPVNFTAVTKKKTASFSNNFGGFFYHKIKPQLFRGYETIKENEFVIFWATKAKALFDYLYFRKNSIVDKNSADELRLNLKEFGKKDKEELKRYIKVEGSKKMEKIYIYLFHRNI